MTVSLPLSVSGRWIVGADGRRVKLAGANWAGAHQDAMVPAGLDVRHRNDIAQTLASWGFNSVRFPFALKTIVNNDGSLRTAAADPARLAANPDLQGQTSWQVYQACVQALTDAGIMVIPNVHLLYCGWCCSDADCNGMWYNDNWPSSTFSTTWTLVAQTFAANPLVVGYDIKNEPRNATIGGQLVRPTWGDQAGTATTDFRLMYSKHADYIHAVDQDALIFCEGLGYAGDLTRAGTHPVTPARPGKVVYELHEYSWFHPSSPVQSQSAYFTDMDNRAGYLLTGNTAPVWVGETGTENASLAAVGVPGAKRGSQSPSTLAQGQWFANFLAWARARDVDWCWWVMDAWHVQGTEPTTNKLVYADRDRASYGLFAQDWRGPSSADLLDQLISLMPATQGPALWLSSTPVVGACWTQQAEEARFLPAGRRSDGGAPASWRPAARGDSRRCDRARRAAGPPGEDRLFRPGPVPGPGHPAEPVRDRGRAARPARHPGLPRRVAGAGRGPGPGRRPAGLGGPG